MRRTLVITLTVGAALLSGAGAASGLTLEEAVLKALEEHPELAAHRAEIGSREGAALQAGLLSNPELEVELEELGGDEGADGIETTVSLSQDLELGGKRSKRRHAAAREADLARLDLEIRRLDLIQSVSTAYVEAATAGEKAVLHEELVGIVSRSLETVAERVRAGKVSPIEETRAKVEMATSRIALRKAWTEWGKARTALAAAWGGSGEEVTDLPSLTAEPSAVPPLEELTEALATSPDQARWDAEIEQRQAAFTVEDAGRIPDLTVTGGVRTIGGADDVTYVAAVSLPLPLFDRNQGGIAEVSATVTRTRAEKLAATRALHAELEATYQEMSATGEELEVLLGSLLSDAQESYEAIREGYRMGKFEYLALLDAQRALLEARTELVAAKGAYHLSRVRLQRLAGTSSLGSNPESESTR